MNGNTAILILIALWAACTFAQAVYCIICAIRANQALETANQCCDLLYELVKIQRRSLWGDNPKTTRTPVERPINGEDHHAG